MKQIDRLLSRATGDDRRWQLMGFVDTFREGVGCEAWYIFWDGVPWSTRKAQRITTHYDTQEEAVTAIEQAGRDFPHPLLSSNILIDDIGCDAL